MARLAPSALITDQGQRVQLRIQGRFYELSQEELRTLLGLPAGPPGLGITIERERLLFEFAGDQQTMTKTERQLARLLAKQLTKKA
jgi:hypothetical protein